MLHRNILTVTKAASAVLVFILFLASYSIFILPNVLVGQTAQWLIIPHDADFQSLQRQLQRKQYLYSTTSFCWAAYLLKYDRKVRPGAYRLRPNMSNWSMVRMLRAGMQQPIKMVLNNIKDKAGLAQKIAENTSIQAADFEALLHNPAFLQRYGFDTDNALAMFIPNTYEVYWTVTPQKLFARMYEEYQRFWTPARRDLAQKIGLTPIQVSILASIVQCELVKAEEAPLIAGVFINRIKKRMRLQSCVTVQHVLGNDSIKRVLRADTWIKSAYNTYRNFGLPPGPIVLPQIATIDAVLHYTRHHYLYFSAKEDFSGAHYFTRSFEEHKNNAQRYRRALNKAQIYR